MSFDADFDRRCVKLCEVESGVESGGERLQELPGSGSDGGRYVHPVLVWDHPNMDAPCHCTTRRDKIKRSFQCQLAQMCGLFVQEI